ncbi:MAG: polyphenol oxidase family protein [Nitriliruptorales bacterium]|nr:polyphenol oxidase family protein [Nitriliruptorales bacterium]
MTIPLRRVGLAPGVNAWFTGRPGLVPEPPVGRAGNLSHRRPHLPARLAADRREVLEEIGLDAGALVWMDQVHGAAVAVVGSDAPPGWQVPAVDGLVTRVAGRGLVVQTADCVPITLAAGDVVAAVHVGRMGLVAGIVAATIEALRGLTNVRPVAVLGPSIGGCCYEVPAAMQSEVVAAIPETRATTSWGTPSLDLRAGVRALLERADVAVIDEVASCTRHEDDWFSHRRDPDAGRQLSIIVRDASA